MSQKCVSGAAKWKLKKEKEENMKILLNKVRLLTILKIIIIYYPMYPSVRKIIKFNQYI